MTEMKDHSLPAIFFGPGAVPGAGRSPAAWGREQRDPYDWAMGFEDAAKALMLAGNFERLDFPVEGVDGGSISMLSVQVG